MLKVKNEFNLQMPVHSYHEDIWKFRGRSSGVFVVHFEQVLSSPEKTSIFLLQPPPLISRLY